MSKHIRYFAVAALLGLLVFEFNGCGFGAPPHAEGEPSVNCINANCITSNAVDMSVTPHVFNGSYSVQAAVPDFNVAGDCNEAGFIYNFMRWQLVLNGALVRDSGMVPVGAYTADSQCVNGRFLLYVYLRPVAQDNMDRSGLLTEGGTRASYQLNILFFGSDTNSTQLSQWSMAQTNLILQIVQ